MSYKDSKILFNKRECIVHKDKNNNLFIKSAGKQIDVNKLFHKNKQVLKKQYEKFRIKKKVNGGLLYEKVDFEFDKLHGKYVIELRNHFFPILKDGWRASLAKGFARLGFGKKSDSENVKPDITNNKLAFQTQLVYNCKNALINPKDNQNFNIYLDFLILNRIYSLGSIIHDDIIKMYGENPTKKIVSDLIKFKQDLYLSLINDNGEFPKTSLPVFTDVINNYIPNMYKEYFCTMKDDKTDYTEFLGDYKIQFDDASKKWTGISEKYPKISYKDNNKTGEDENFQAFLALEETKERPGTQLDSSGFGSGSDHVDPVASLVNNAEKNANDSPVVVAAEAAKSEGADAVKTAGTALHGAYTEINTAIESVNNAIQNVNTAAKLDDDDAIDTINKLSDEIKNGLSSHLSGGRKKLNNKKTQNVKNKDKSKK